MSAVSTSRAKKVDPLSKKTPANPKYANVRPVVDTGSSVTKYLEHLEYLSTYYKKKNGEIFNRMKISTFVQLIIQVGDFENSTATHNGNGDVTERPDTADEEVRRIQQGQRSHHVDEKLDTSRSTLQSVTKGVGELDVQSTRPAKPNAEELLASGCPYLLLDVRDQDAYKQCRLITAKNYPAAMLSRENFDTKEMWSYKNYPGKIIVIYDEDERIAPNVATVLTQRGYDNLFLLSGGMKVAYKIFPEGLFTGTPSRSITESAKPPKEMTDANQTEFTSFDYERLETYLDIALQDKTVGSRLSKASSRTGSVTSVASSKASRYPATSRQEGKVAHPHAFKP